MKWRIDPQELNPTRCSFGILESLGFAGLFAGADAAAGAGLAAGAGELAGTVALPTLELTGGAAASGLGGAEAIGALGGLGAVPFGAATGLGAAGASLGAADALGLGAAGALAGGAASAFGSAGGGGGNVFDSSFFTPTGGSDFASSPALSNFTPSTASFDTVNPGSPIDFGTSAPPAGSTASSFAPPSGVSGVSGVTDPTAAGSLPGGSVGAGGAPLSGTPEAGALQGAQSVSGGGLTQAGGDFGAPFGQVPAANPSSGNFLTQGFDKLVSSAAQNPWHALGAGLGAGGLAYSILANKSPSGTPQLGQEATALQAQGAQLTQYLQNGTLPPGMQTAVDQATRAAKARAVSNAAANGQPTDPTKNTSLASQFNAIDQQAQISAATIAQQLLTTGINETGLSSQIFNNLASIDQTEQANIGRAIASFASAVGGTPNIQIGKV